MPRILILGTGTGVGKTYVTVALARALRRADPTASVVALKPVETGVSRGADGAPARGTDAWRLERASRGASLRPHPLYALPDPIAAHLAARRTRVAVSLPAIARWIASTALPDATIRVSWVLIETAGGAFSPLTRRAVNADLRAALRPDVCLLVAPDALGVLHDVRATITALGPAAIDHVVLSRSGPRDASTGTNAGELGRLGLPRPVAVLPRGGPASALAPLVRALRRSR